MPKIKKWNVIDTSSHRGEIKRIADELNILYITALLLYNRGYRTPEKALNFLKLEAELFHNPFLLADMDKACGRIIKALEEKERIVIYGDYDVDGVTSVSSLLLYLKGKGGDVGYYIPNRTGEGYGVNSAALKQLADGGTKLLITVDTGITAVGEVTYAKELGMDVIITDHHRCHELLPDAAAVVNPRREDSLYPFRELAGAGVAFKLMTALEFEIRRREGRPTDGYLHEVCSNFIDLIALGTIADVMPLVDENRLIVSMGLSYIENTARPGLLALLELAGIHTKKSGAQKAVKRRVTSSMVGYVIAPRINAAGRISSASQAVELFLADSKEKAKSIAEELCEANRERQSEENKIIEQTYAKIDKEHDFSKDYVIVLDDDNWHHGIIGIVSSRITDHYNRPSILISFEGDTGKGSGRSIKGLNLVEALMSCSDLLIKFGGHELAAGLSIERSKLPEFRRRINEYAREHLSKNDLVTTIDVDCELDTSDINLRQADELDLLEPYGISNQVPLFILRDAVIADTIQIGSNRHTKLILEKDGIKLTAVYFGVVASELEFCPGDMVDTVFNLGVNDFMGTRSVQLVVKDMNFSEKQKAARRAETAIYKEIKEGRYMNLSEEYIPDRDDFVRVYLHLKQEYRQGTGIIGINRLKYLLNRNHLPDTAPMNYVKLEFIMDILSETQIITAERFTDTDAVLFDEFSESPPEKYRFKLNNITTKVNLDKSCIYKCLRNRTEKI